LYHTPLLISQKTVIFVLVGVTTWNLTFSIDKQMKRNVVSCFISSTSAFVCQQRLRKDVEGNQAPVSPELTLRLKNGNLFAGTLRFLHSEERVTWATGGGGH
jgi:hypothetical protein